MRGLVLVLLVVLAAPLWIAHGHAGAQQEVAEDATPAPQQPATPRDLLIEYARLRGLIDGCTRSGNRVDFQSLIDRMAQLEKGGLLQSLGNGHARYRAALQSQVNATYASAYAGSSCESASDLILQGGRSEAVRAALDDALPPGPRTP